MDEYLIHKISQYLPPLDYLKLHRIFSTKHSNLISNIYYPLNEQIIKFMQSILPSEISSSELLTIVNQNGGIIIGSFLLQFIYQQQWSGSDIDIIVPDVDSIDRILYRNRIYISHYDKASYPKFWNTPYKLSTFSPLNTRIYQYTLSNKLRIQVFTIRDQTIYRGLNFSDLTCNNYYYNGKEILINPMSVQQIIDRQFSINEIHEKTSARIHKYLTRNLSWKIEISNFDQFDQVYNLIKPIVGERYPDPFLNQRKQQEFNLELINDPIKITIYNNKKLRQTYTKLRRRLLKIAKSTTSNI